MINQEYIKNNKRISSLSNNRALASASVASSIVSGIGSTEVVKGDTVIIRVDAKDSSGNSISTGGENFMIKISNSWTKTNDHYWDLTGSSNILSTSVYSIMTDHNNGTYTYSYIIPSLSKLKLIR